jgi:hypothetical protein
LTPICSSTPTRSSATVFDMMRSERWRMPAETRSESDDAGIESFAEAQAGVDDYRLDRGSALHMADKNGPA